MANYNEKRDRELLKVFSESTVIDTYILDNGAMQLDKAICNSKKAETFLQDKIDIKKRMIAILKDAQCNGMTESKKQELKQLQNLLSDKRPNINNEYKIIETQDITSSFDELVISNKAYAQKYNSDYPFEISPPSERCCWVLLKPRKPLKIRQFIHAKAL